MLKEKDWHWCPCCLCGSKESEECETCEDSSLNEHFRATAQERDEYLQNEMNLKR